MMMSDPFEHIDDYINNALSPSDRIDFEDAMKADETLRFAVNEYETLRLIALSEIDAEVDAAFKQEAVQKVKKIRPSFNKYLIAAAMVGVIAAVFGLIRYQNHQAYLEKVEIAMADYTPPQVISTRSGEGELISVMDKAKDAFAKRDYDLCIDILNKIDPSQQDDEYHWLKGHALFIKKDFGGAKKEFEKVGSSSNVYKDVKEMKRLICHLWNKSC